MSARRRFGRRAPEDLDDRLVEVAKGRLRASEFDSIASARDAAIVFLDSLESARTVSTYCSNIVAFFRWCLATSIEPFTITRPEAHAYYASLRRLSSCGRSNRLIPLRSFWTSLLREPYPRVENNWWLYIGPKNVRPKMPTRALTMQQAEELLRALRAQCDERPELLIRHRDFAMFYMMLRLGPRRVTIAHLRWMDLAIEDGIAVFNFFLKGGRYEQVALSPDLVEELRAWFLTLSASIGRDLRPDDGVFPAVGSWTRTFEAPARLEPLSAAAISWVVKERLRAVNRVSGMGLTGRGWSAHSLRATAATIASENGARLDEVQAMLCHLNQAQTKGYIRRGRPQPSAARYWVPDLDGERAVPLIRDVRPLFLGPGSKS